MTRGEIWLVNLDPTVRGEIREARPCVVVSPSEMHDWFAHSIAFFAMVQQDELFDILSTPLYKYREVREVVAKHKLRTPHREQDQHQGTEANDPVLAMLGVGRQLWELEPGDNFVERLRSEDPPAPPAMHPSPAHAESLPETVWQRIVSHQGEQFQTVSGLPFTFEVEGSGIWFFRDGRRVNRKLTRTQFEMALSRCPLARTTEISDLMDYPYLFAVLTDRRIRGQEW